MFTTMTIIGWNYGNDLRMVKFTSPNTAMIIFPSPRPAILLGNHTTYTDGRVFSPADRHLNHRLVTTNGDALIQYPMPPVLIPAPIAPPIDHPIDPPIAPILKRSKSVPLIKCAWVTDSACANGA